MREKKKNVRERKENREKKNSRGENRDDLVVLKKNHTGVEFVKSVRRP